MRCRYVEADYTDKHEASRGLCATAELLVESLLMTCAKNYKKMADVY